MEAEPGSDTFSIFFLRGQCFDDGLACDLREECRVDLTNHGQSVPSTSLSRNTINVYQRTIGSLRTNGNVVLSKVLDVPYEESMLRSVKHVRYILTVVCLRDDKHMMCRRWVLVVKRNEVVVLVEDSLQ